LYLRCHASCGIVHREALYFTNPMGTKRVWTIKEIADATGYSRVTVHNDLNSGVFHAKRANPGKTWIKLYLGPSLAEYMQKQKAKKNAARVAKPRPSRAGRISQTREKKIDKLFEILKNRTEVDASEKALAIGFFKSMFALLDARYGYKPRPVYHLLEGIEALFKSDRIFVDKHLVYLDDEIKQLPTRSETTPQTEQSFLNV
jgi:hypothetical protein